VELSRVADEMCFDSLGGDINTKCEGRGNDGENNNNDFFINGWE